MSWQFIEGQKRHTQDGCNLVALMKPIPAGKTVKVIDIGCGDGIMISEIFRLRKASFAVGVDISKEAMTAALKNLETFIGEKKVELHRSSFQSFLKLKARRDIFDRVVINPPFFPQGSGRHNKTGSDQLARHEGSLNLKVWALGASKLLRMGGGLYCVFPTERLAECLVELSKSRLAPKELWWFENDRRKRRFFLRATKGAKHGLITHTNFSLT